MNPSLPRLIPRINSFLGRPQTQQVREGRCNWFCQESLQGGARLSYIFHSCAPSSSSADFDFSVFSVPSVVKSEKLNTEFAENHRGTQRSLPQFTQQGNGIPRRREQALALASTIENIFRRAPTRGRTRVRRHCYRGAFVGSIRAEH